MTSLTPSENEYADKVTTFLYNLAANITTEKHSELRDLGGQRWLENKLYDMFKSTVSIPLMPFFVRTLFELGSFRMDRKNILIGLNKKYGLGGGYNTPRHVYNFIINLVMVAKHNYKQKLILDDMNRLLKFVLLDNLKDLDDLSATESVYSSDELKNLNNYLTLRDMKPDTQKHFGDILSAL